MHGAVGGGLEFLTGVVGEGRGGFPVFWGVLGVILPEGFEVFSAELGFEEVLAVVATGALLLFLALGFLLLV